MPKVVYLCPTVIPVPPTGFFAFKGLCLSGQCPRCLSTMHTSGVFSTFALALTCRGSNPSQRYEVAPPLRTIRWETVLTPKPRPSKSDRFGVSF